MTLVTGHGCSHLKTVIYQYYTLFVIGGYFKATLIKEYLLSNQVIEEPVKKWQNVGGANTLVKISFHK